MRANADTFLDYINNKNFNYTAASIYSNKQLVSVYAQKKRNRVASFFNLKLLFTKPSEWKDRVLNGRVLIEYTVPNDGSIDSKIVNLLKHKGFDTRFLTINESISALVNPAKINSPPRPSESEASSASEMTSSSSETEDSEFTETEISSESESLDSSSSEEYSVSSSATMSSKSKKSPEEIKNLLRSYFVGLPLQGAEWDEKINRLSLEDIAIIQAMHDTMDSLKDLKGKKAVETEFLQIGKIDSASMFREVKIKGEAIDQESCRVGDKEMHISLTALKVLLRKYARGHDLLLRIET